MRVGEKARDPAGKQQQRKRSRESPASAGDPESPARWSQANEEPAANPARRRSLEDGGFWELVFIPGPHMGRDSRMHGLHESSCLSAPPFFAISPAIPASVAASQHSVQPRQVSLHRQPASLHFQPPLPHRSSSHRRALFADQAPLRRAQEVRGGRWKSRAKGGMVVPMHGGRMHGRNLEPRKAMGGTYCSTPCHGLPRSSLPAGHGHAQTPVPLACSTSQVRGSQHGLDVRAAESACED